jgi:hypothetical protein
MRYDVYLVYKAVIIIKADPSLDDPRVLIRGAYRYYSGILQNECSK